MSDQSQIVVPPSFIALYQVSGCSKPSATRAEIAARHEFCEDLASLLTEHAGAKLWELGVTEADVLERMHRGLRVDTPGSPASVSPAEARWVICRLAELLGWAMPGGCESPPAA